MRTILRNGWYLLSFSVLVSLMTSCLGDSYLEDTYPLTDAELISFSLSSDSVSELKKVAFTIDQRAGLIYNYDSMAYLTEIKDKVIINYTSGSGTNNVLNITNGDSIWVASGDSIDISTPLTFKVYAPNGVTTKLYNVQLNIHQIDPDSMQYHRIASDLPFLQTEDTKTIAFNKQFLAYSRIGNEILLFSSPDAMNWTQEAVSGLPANAVIKGILSKGDQLFAYTDDGELYVRYDLSIDQWILVNKPASIKIKSILGYLNQGPKYPEGLSMVVEVEDKYVFAFTDDFIQWDYDASSPVPDDFPLYDFSTCSYSVMLTERISIFGGISLNGFIQNAVWSTENGRYWAKLTGAVNVFPPLKGANAIYYNNEFWLMNGQSGNDYNKDIYFSKDGGVTWQVKPGKYSLPENYPGRFGASVVIDQNNKYFYIIGGKQATALSEVWKGFLNKMDFAH